MSTKRRFSIGDYLWRRAFDSKTSSRGLYEREIIQSYIKEDGTDLVTPFSTRALQVGTPTAGGNLVGDSASDSPAFQSFYQNSFFMSRATILDGLSSDVILDSKITSAVLTSNSVTENQANSLSTEPALGAFKLSPKFIRVSLDLSTTLLETSSKGIDDLIISEISSKLASTLDYEIFFGGGGDAIKGITTETGIGNIRLGALGLLDGASAFVGVVECERGLAKAKVPSDDNYFLFNAATRTVLRNLRKTPFMYPILTDENKIIGIDTFHNQNLRDADIFLIAPKNVVLGMWHDRERVDILVDSWSKGSSGLISLTVSIICDARLIQPKALYTCTES